VESNATPYCPGGSVSSGILSVVTPGRDRVADMDIEYVEKIISVASKGTNRNPRKWVVRKRGSHVGELDQKLNLTTGIL